MKLKSLLIGSAAVLTAVSTARAADAIIVEPEPVDYVRVCDMYGTGFFYIPGTETCINFNGYVRSTYASGHSEREVSLGTAVTVTYETIDGDTDTTLLPGLPYVVNNFANTTVVPLIDITVLGDPELMIVDGDSEFVTRFVQVPGLLDPAFDSESDWHSWTYRARLNIDVRNETEYGTLRSEMRFQAGDTNDQDGNVAIDRALISLAGFRLGYSDTYWTTNHGYGAGSPAINDGFYNYDQAIFFDYTYTMDNFSVTVGVQDSDSGAPNFAGVSGGYADFYAGFNWGSEWGTFAFTAIRDSSARKLETFAGLLWHYDRDAAWAYKASAIIPLADSGWTLGGWYAWSESNYTKYVNAYGATPNAGIDQEWGVQISGALSDNLTAYALYTAASGETDFDDVTGLSVVDSLSDNEVHAWAVGVVWTPVSQLSVQLEYAAQEATSDLINGASITDTTDGFYVRVTRSF